MMTPMGDTVKLRGKVIIRAKRCRVDTETRVRVTKAYAAETIDFSTVPGARTWNSIAQQVSWHARVLLSVISRARIKAAVVLSIR